MGAANLDQLFMAPHKAFVAERKRLVAQLRAAGRLEEAKEAQKMPRPSLPAWTVNQLARREAPLLQRLAEITGQLQRAQRRSAGAERVDDTAAVVAAHREVLKQLRDGAEQILNAAGETARPQVLERVLRNLRVGIAGAETRPTIESGRLVRDLAEQDFVSLLGAVPGAPESSRAGRAEPARRAGQSDRRQAAAQAKAEARARADAQAERNRARLDAERRVRALRTKDEAARKVLGRAEREADRASRAAAQANEELQQARLNAERSAKELQAAEVASRDRA